MKLMIDLHMHIIPGVDDGSNSLDMSEQMLRMAIDQGVEVVFATPHDDAHRFDSEYTRVQYRRLQKMIKDKELPIEVYLSAEMLYDEHNPKAMLEDLKSGRIPTLNDTKYVLTEFWLSNSNQLFGAAKRLLEEECIPVIAHAERIPVTMEVLYELKKMGCLIQMNVFSAFEEKNEEVKHRAQAMLDLKMVDFVGSDSHRTDHRPPSVAKGIEFLYEKYDEEYVDDILYNNAYRLLICNPEDFLDLETTEYIPGEEKTSYWKDGIMGVIVGDALGLPVQFRKREELREAPVIEMDGFGTFDMPKGSWSDDGSMTLATLASIKEKNGIDYDDMMKRFVDWDENGACTPLGFAYDQGNTCSYAIAAYKRDGDYRTCGRTGEWNNGNGSLMRILPVCLYAYEQRKQNAITLDQAMEMVHTVCALTHNTQRAKIGCGIYYFLVEAILDNKNNEKKQPLLKVLQKGINRAKKYYEMDLLLLAEVLRYGRLFNLSDFANTSEDNIMSNGYVVHTLEAAVWSFITTTSFEECLLKAVNLGDDTDTVGAVVGGLAGLYYGCEGMPEEWLEAVWKTDELIDILDNMK